jgi:Bacterial membrane protein YfhO
MRIGSGQSRDRQGAEGRWNRLFRLPTAPFKARLGMALLMLAIVAGFYWKLTLTRQFDWLWAPDQATQVLPWFQVQARAWNNGTIALWDPYVWAGQPLLGQAQPGAAYPLNWILFALPLRHDGLIRWWALQWYFVAIRFMALVFCYLLCRDLGRSRAASLVGGCVFALGGYIGSTSWPQMVNGALWLPLVFLFLLRAGRGERPLRNAVLSGTFLGVAWLSGHHQAPMFLMLAAAGAWLYFVFRAGRPDWRMARAAALALVFTVLTGALQILPAYEYGHLAKRWVGAPEALGWNQPVPYAVHQTYDLKPFDLLGTVFPRVNTNADPFVGAAALFLALLGLAVGWRDARVRLLSAVGLGGLVYALGQHSVFQGFLYGLIPELDKARVVSAAVVVFQFAVAALAAFGLDQLVGQALPPANPSRETLPGESAWPTSPWPQRFLWGAFGFGLFTLAVFQTIFFVNKWSFPGEDTVMLTPFVALGFAALVFAALRGAVSRRQTAVLMLLLVLLELGNNTGSVFASRANAAGMKWLDQMRGNTDVAEFLKRDAPFPRANVAEDAFAENWGALHGVEMMGGSLASLTRNMQYVETWSLPTRLLWGAAYTLSAKPSAVGQLVFTGASGIRVYRHAGVFPRAWAVHELIQAPTPEVGRRMIQEQLPDFRHLGYMLAAPPPLDACAAQDDVALTERSTDRVVIHAGMHCQGMVVLSDVFFPGWRAEVDGHATPIYEVNEAMRGVVVPLGEHTITMRYRPASALAGALLSLIGIAGATFCGRLSVFRRAFRSRDREGAVARPSIMTAFRGHH